MIGLLLSLALQQVLAPPTVSTFRVVPPDLPALIEMDVKSCVATQIFFDNHPDVPSLRNVQTRRANDGSEAQHGSGRGHCQIIGPTWTPEGETMAQAVRAGLVHLPQSVEVVQWRVPLTNERGPAVWTTFVRKNADDAVIGVVNLIEPADGETGEVSITYQAVQP